MVLPDDGGARPGRGHPARVICMGKVYIDLVAGEQRDARPDVAICRLEQLYPVPMRDLRAMFETYPNAERSSGSRKSRRTWARGNSSGRT